MRFLFAVIFLIGSILLSFKFRHDIEVVMIGIATILGFVLGKVFDLQKDLNAMRTTLAREWEERNSTKQTIATSSEVSASTIIKESARKGSDADDPSPVQPQELKVETSTVDTQHQAENTSNIDAKQSATQYISRSAEKSFPIEDTIFDKAGDVLKGYFTGGNLFVRIGIIILFLGVSFLLKYVSDQGLFPIEYRLIGVVVLAMFF